MVDPRVAEALRFQRRAVGRRSMASPLYAALLDAALDDVDRDGPCAAVLARAPEGIDPIPDALVLRFLGAVHRLVLGGGAPELVPWFPTAGGSADPADDGGVGPVFLAVVAAHADELAAGLAQPVQTNEVGRCATLAVGFTELLRRHRLPLRLLELGASAGLNLRWDRWRYESPRSSWGAADAALRFGDGVYHDPFPDLDAALGPEGAVAERLGCDRSPIDATTEAGARLLRSFVWPDQAERLARLDAAIAVAAAVPARVEAADAADFVAARLAATPPGTTTVVLHSIVWQYLPEPTRVGVVEALSDAGARARPDAPLAWLRMEPGADLAEAAELRLTTWAGGRRRAPDDRLLALSGYHGRPVRLAR